MVLTGLAACGAPSGQVAVTPDGQAAGRVSSGNVTVAGGPSGPAAAVRVIDTASTDVTVGTGGATASVAPRGLPVRVGLGRGGIRLGF
ncbi:hypothetical protein SAMN05444722_2330 [Rhodovulum sp. ES.010]|nr:hypothetical protein SAMN05444722_2330 [Rhodovulum sp. ES.010]